MPACDHCLLEVQDRDAVRAEIDGRTHIFCCNGCSGIYRMIHSEGLDDFYTRRKDWQPGPAELASVDVSAFVSDLRPVGADIETDVVIEGIRCASCVWLNEKVLMRTKGITFASVNYATHRAKIRWNPAVLDIAAVLSRIKSIGYTPKPVLNRAADEERKLRSRDQLVRLGTAFFFSMQLMLFSVALYAGYFQGIDDRTRLLFHIISLILATPVVFYSGWSIIRGSLRGIANLTFNMDVLITSGALAAYGFSIIQIVKNGEVYFDTAAMIVTLILLGRYIEDGAKASASETVTRLFQLSPREARRVLAENNAHDAESIRTAQRTLVQVSGVQPQELIEVVPGEKIPLDGVVVSGSSETDESMLTGESRPAPKQEGSQVFCGTRNLYGSFVFQVTRIGRDTLLSQIIRAVEDAQSRRAPIQSVADRVVGWFVPAILGIALLTFTGWLYHGAPVSQAVINAVSVLVIACPCALGLATPLAILISTTHAASLGILVKGGDVIEKAASIDYVVFDKTGTITEGKTVLREYRGIGIPDSEALRIASSLERNSEHSIGKAIVDAGRSSDPFSVDDFSAIPGRGLRGMIEKKQVLIGNKEFATAGEDAVSAEVANMIAAHESAGSTIVYLAVEGNLRGVFMIADSIRPEARKTVAQLDARNISAAMITGDAPNTAHSVAASVGIKRVMPRVLPIGKADEVRRLKDDGRNVMMVGDGINDAPGLVEANVGVAMGRATDVALDSADIVIMRPDLMLVSKSLLLAKKTFSIIRQNIFWAFFYNVVAIPLAISGKLHPIIAAGSMAISSLFVVGNSLRARTK
jgi:Cu2+-exporting ATPase